MNRFIGSLSILEELLSTPIIIPNYIIYTIVAIIFVEYMFYRVQTLNEYFEYNSLRRNKRCLRIPSSLDSSLSSTPSGK